MIDQLYEKVGGSKTINRLVRIFYARVLADSRLAPFFPNTDMEGLRAQQTMFLTMLLGGKSTFTGRDLTAAHANARVQGLTDEHFDAVIDHFAASLRELDVDETYAQEILTLIETKRDAVLDR